MNRKRVPLFITLYYYFNIGNVLLCVIYQLNLNVLSAVLKNYQNTTRHQIY
jgi:D-hexose-6-phosphate mutarotase